MQVYAWIQNQIWTSKHSNQNLQNPKGLDHWLKSFQERIEGVFHELAHKGRNPEGLLAKALVGLGTRVIGEMTSQALKHVLNIQF
jgi:hypothetical protein